MEKNRAEVTKGIADTISVILKMEIPVDILPSLKEGDSY
jgi:hypothetical protein